MKKKNKIVKLKVRHSVAKRFKMTSTGKIMRRCNQNRHLKANRTQSNSRRKRAPRLVKGKLAKKLIKMLAR